MKQQDGQGERSEGRGVPRGAFSQLLAGLAVDPPADGKLSFDSLMERAGKGGPAFLMLFLCLLSMIFSVVPGVSTVIGLPLLLLSWQMALGRARLSLPKWLGRRTLDHTTLVQGLMRRLELVHRIERFVRPRLGFLCRGGALRLIGLTGVVCAVVLSLPIPLMNFPPTLAVFLMALGILGGDGVMVLAGLLLAAGVVVTLVLVAFLVPEMLAGVWDLLGFGGAATPPP